MVLARGATCPGAHSFLSAYPVTHSAYPHTDSPAHTHTVTPMHVCPPLVPSAATAPTAVTAGVGAGSAGGDSSVQAQQAQLLAAQTTLDSVALLQIERLLDESHRKALVCLDALGPLDPLASLPLSLPLPLPLALPLDAHYADPAAGTDADVDVASGAVSGAPRLPTLDLTFGDLLLLHKDLERKQTVPSHHSPSPSALTTRTVSGPASIE